MTAVSPQLIDDICTQLKGNVTQVLDTMFSLQACSTEAITPHPAGEMLVAGSVGFIGDVNGVVYAHVTAKFARELASRMLAMPQSEIEGDEMVNDVIGELCNMLVGSVKSRLCDSGSPCVLTIPSIVRGQNFSVQSACASERRVLGFQCGTDSILVEVQMKLCK